MKIYCVDLEATCWDSNPPSGQVSEIIEVGLATLDTSDDSITKEQILVRPIASEVSEFCTNLTGLTQEKLDLDGLTKEDAWNMLLHRWKRGRYWCSWGFYDLKKLLEDSEMFGLKMPLHPAWHNNVKSAFGLFFLNGKSEGMSSAVEKMGLSFEGRPHCGADDAYNLACIVRELRKKSILT